MERETNTVRPRSDPGKAILYTLKNSQFVHIQQANI